MITTLVLLFIWTKVLGKEIGQIPIIGKWISLIPIPIKVENNNLK